MEAVFTVMTARDLTDRLIRPTLARLRTGPRQVLWTPPRIGLGNMLYLWLWARTRREQGIDAWVLGVPAMEPWFAEFDVLRELTLDRKDVGWRDQRPLEWAQAWGYHYSGDQLIAFASELINSPPFAARRRQCSTQLSERTLVVNVRRGDYYSVPEHRERFGMNLVGWVKHAVPLALESTPIERIQLVSDDLDWCARELRWLERIRPTSFDRIGVGPADDLAVLTSADALVLSNSTFSYWGGHFNGARRGGGDHSIVAPAFHGRGQSDGNRSWHLDPAWRIIEDIPGGWGEV